MRPYCGRNSGGVAGLTAVFALSPHSLTCRTLQWGVRTRQHNVCRDVLERVQWLQRQRGLWEARAYVVVPSRPAANGNDQSAQQRQLSRPRKNRAFTVGHACAPEWRASACKIALPCCRKSGHRIARKAAQRCQFAGQKLRPYFGLAFGPAGSPGGPPKSELSVGPSMTRATFGAPLAAIRGTKTAAGIRPRFWPAEMHCWAALPRRIGPANLTQMVFQKQHRGQLHRRCASEPREARKTDWTATPRVEPACTSDASITLPEPHLAGSTVEA